MLVDVETKARIDCPPETVAAYAGDPSNAPEWYVNIRSVEWEGPARVEIGARVTFVAHFLGRRLSYTYEICDWVPGSRLVMRTAEGPFPMETTYHWEASADGATEMTLRNRGEPSGFSKLASPFMRLAVRRANRKDLIALKRVLESRCRDAGVE